ncbi:MAG: transglycosylase SLT domain-containing protein [Acidobacteriota bacterium]|nr:transglycosylase SLT domain-containing protein [Acidobacteriota bacterium]
MYPRRRVLNFLLLLAVFVSATFAFGADPFDARETNAAHPRARLAPKRRVKAATKKKRQSPRFRRTRQAFVASTTLRPMARQLLQDRSPAAYAGVQAYAARHSKEDAGALAWLVLGYARFLDRDFPKTVEALNRAQPNAGELGDYVSYYLASTYLQMGKSTETITTLGSFDSKFPDSLLVRDARLLNASALLAAGKPQDAIAILEKDRQPTRADFELALGRAYAASAQPAKAVEILRNIYFSMPLSNEAGDADAELKKLPPPATAVPPTFAERRTRAELVMKGKHFNEAAGEYRGLINDAAPSERPLFELAFAEALQRTGQSKEAKQALDVVPETTPEIKAQKLFDNAEVQRSVNDDDGFLRTLDQLRQTYPTSPWLEQGLLSAGNIYLLRKDYDHAIDAYRELQKIFPNAARASYAHWKVAWLSLRQGRNAEAKTGFEQQITLYPKSGEVPAALYWRARLGEEDNDFVLARAYYQKLSDRFRNYYYGELARERLAKLPVSNEPAGNYPLLDRVISLDSGLNISVDPVPEDDLRVQKAQLLENGALLDFAVKELRAANEEDKGSWLPAEIARMYSDAGRYDRAIEVLKRAVPSYFAVELPSLPRPYWEALFPKAYWPDLKRYASGNALDPYLVASLIRQESEFNPNAVSRANALGLMQLLPKVGKTVAKQVKLKHFSPPQLFTPAINLQLGTKYFRSMVDKFGAFEYALAAYNAGGDRVEEWLGQAKYRDPQEFVESIPFTETREYVQAILRNANVYRQLYGNP